jgi:hypothetical protein
MSAPACGGSKAAAPVNLRPDGGTSVDAQAPTDDGGACGALGAMCCADDACDVPLACVRGTCVSTTVETTPDRSVKKLEVGGCPQSIAVNAATVFWSDTAAGTVNAMPIAGGVPVVLASQVGPGPLAIDATSVYWLDDGAGIVAKVPLAGGTVTTLASAQGGPQALVVDTTSVYWTSGGNIEKVPIDGGTPTTLVPSVSSSAIAVDSANLYWTSYDSRWVLTKLPLAGGPPVPLVASTEPSPQSLAIDGQYAYWSQGDLVKAPLDGGDITVLVANHRNAAAVAVDATSLYWIDSVPIVPIGSGDPNPQPVSLPVGGDVMKVSLADGTVTTLATGAIFPVAFAIDATSVYVASCDLSGDQGAVLQITPK